MRNKTMKAALAALALMTMTAVGAWADSNPANDKDSLTIRITPSVDLGVDLDTTTTRWTNSANMDVSLALGAAEYFAQPATATIQGNFAKQELEVVGQALDTWSLDTDDFAQEPDSAQLWALFGTPTGNDSGDAPGNTELYASGSGENLVTATPKMAGQPVADEGNAWTNTQFEAETAGQAYSFVGAVDADDLVPAQKVHLWLGIKAPATSTSEEQQRFVITLTAKNGVLN